MLDDRIVSRKSMAKQLRDIADAVEEPYGEYRSADPDLRDTLLGMVDSLYCKAFPDEDEECEDEDEE